MHVESKLRKPLITGGKTLSDVSDDISKRVEEKPSISWYIAMAISNITLAGEYCSSEFNRQFNLGLSEFNVL